MFKNIKVKINKTNSKQVFEKMLATELPGIENLGFNNESHAKFKLSGQAEGIAYLFKSEYSESIFVGWLGDYESINYYEQGNKFTEISVEDYLNEGLTMENITGASLAEVRKNAAICVKGLLSGEISPIQADNIYKQHISIIDSYRLELRAVQLAIDSSGSGMNFKNAIELVNKLENKN